LHAEVLLFDRRTESNGGVDACALFVGFAGRAALTPNAKPTGLTFVLGTELLWSSVRNALEGAAVFVLGAVRVIRAVREATLIGARTASAGNTLLGFRTRAVEARDEAFAVDADSIVPALEIELTAERGRIRFLFEGVQAQAVVRTGRTHWAVVSFLAFADAAKSRAQLPDRAVRVGFAKISLRRGLRVTFVPPAQETAALAQGPVRDAEIAGVPVTAGDPE
jgi:hypothetical protein